MEINLNVPNGNRLEFPRTLMTSIQIIRTHNSHPRVEKYRKGERKITSNIRWALQERLPDVSRYTETACSKYGRARWGQQTDRPSLPAYKAGAANSPSDIVEPRLWVKTTPAPLLTAHSAMLPIVIGLLYADHYQKRHKTFPPLWKKKKRSKTQQQEELFRRHIHS